MTSPARNEIGQAGRTFRHLDSLTLPGDHTKPNDDAFAHRSTAAVVMDGATGLGEPLLHRESDAAWVAHFGCERLVSRMATAEDAQDALRAALADTEAEFARLRRRAPKEKYEIPCASMMFVTLSREKMRALWFGDCVALVRRADEQVEIVGDALVKRAKERQRVAWLAASFGASAADASVRDIFLPALRRARNHVNTDAGGWLFGPDVRAAGHAAHAEVDVREGTVVLLASDGFLALASDYECYTMNSLLDAAQARGLAELGRELRAVEEADPQGKRFPRFKKSDDATALLLRIDE